MGLFIPGKKSRHRRFSYDPRFYNPEKEEKLRRRMRIERKTRKRKSPAGIIYFVLLLSLVVYVYLKLG